MSELAQGVRDVERGLAFLNAHPRLWGWVVAPAIVTFFLISALIYAVTQLLVRIVGSLTAHLPSWLQGSASKVLSVIIVVALIAGAILVFVALVGVITGPFCERLSEAVEVHLLGRPAPAFSLTGFLMDTAVGLIHGVRRLLVAVFGAVFLLMLSCVPVVGTLAALVVGGWLAARAAAYDSYDAILARRALAYRHKILYLRNHRGRTFGLGATVAGLLLVPGLNLVALGVGAVGATLAVHDFDAEAEERLRRSSKTGSGRA